MVYMQKIAFEEHIPWWPSWATLLLTLAAILFCGSALLRLILAFLIPGLRIGGFGWLSVKNISLSISPPKTRVKSKEGAIGDKRKSENFSKVDTARLKVGQLGWSCLSSLPTHSTHSANAKGTSKPASAATHIGNSWIILKAKNVEVYIPKSFLFAIQSKSAEPRASATRAKGEKTENKTATLSEELSPTSRGVFRRLCSTCHHRMLVPAVLRLQHFFITLITSISIFSIEVTFTITVEDIAVIRGQISAGGHMALSREAGAWVALHNVEISEAELDDPPSKMPAFEMKDSLVLSVTALLSHMDLFGLGGDVLRQYPLFHPRSLDVQLEIVERRIGNNVSEGIHARVYEVKRILRAAETLLTPIEKSSRVEEVVQNSGDLEENGPIRTNAVETNRKSTSPAHLLSSIKILIPTISISAHYHTPTHILSAETSHSTPLPQSVAFVLCMKGLTGRLATGQRSKAEHSMWLGKELDLDLGGNLHWTEVEGRVKINGDKDNVLKDSSKAFSIGASSLHITSTRPAQQASSSSNVAATDIDTNVEKMPYRTSNFNDQAIIFEFLLGKVLGHVSFETLDSALRIFKARPKMTTKARPMSKAALEEVGDTKNSPTIFRNLPRILGAGCSEGIDIRIQAPLDEQTPRLGSNTDEEDEYHFYRSWKSPELFCINLTHGTLNIDSEYSDRSLRRREADRIKLKREQRKARESNHSGDIDHEILGVLPQPPKTEVPNSQSNEDRPSDASVPPPPPLQRKSGKSIHIPSATGNVGQDLNKHSLQYSASVHSSLGMLSVFILAKNHGVTEHEQRSQWLKQKPQLPSDPLRLDILAIGATEITAQQKILGGEEDSAGMITPILDVGSLNGDVGVLIETVGIDLWRPLVMGSLRDFVQSFVGASANATVRDIGAPSHVRRKSSSNSIVSKLQLNNCVHFAIAHFDARLAGSDPKNDEKACRGISVHSKSLVLDFLATAKHTPPSVDFPSRQSLELCEDIKVEACALVAEHPGKTQALVKMSLNEVHIDPVVDARTSKEEIKHMPMTTDEDGRLLLGDDWELRNRAHMAEQKRRKSIIPVRTTEPSKGVLHLPEMTFRIRIKEIDQANSTEDVSLPVDDIVLSIEADSLTVRVELFTMYLCLVAFSAVKGLFSTVNTRPSAEQTPAKVTGHSKPVIHLRLEITDLNLFPTLPHNVRLFAHIRRLRMQSTPQDGFRVDWDMLLLAGDSPTVGGKWEDIIRFRITSIVLASARGTDPDSEQGLSLNISSDSARLRIPFRYIFSRIVDNAANLIKAMKQLVHQLVKGKMDWVLEPAEEGVKKLPSIRLNVKMLAIEIQDDPFETRLNIIWRAGYEEQTSRLDRQIAFDAKVEAIHRMESQGESPDDTEEKEEFYGTPHSRKRGRLTGDHSIGIEEAKYDLMAYNSSHWAKRIRNAVAEQGRREEQLTRRLYGPRHNSQRPDSLLPIDLLSTGRSVPLARATFHDLRFALTPPSFGYNEVPNFLHDVGKGMPRDSKYTLLVPLHFSWKMEEARVQLRDYPLPLIHVPPMSHNGGAEFASWEAEGDIVIAEELSGIDAIRRVPCEIVPAYAANGLGRLYSVVVPRSAMPVKTYALPIIRIRSPYGTRIGWGNSIQPAIQDVAKVIDTLSKASADPSERIGFWDKLRLQMHWRIQVLFQGDGPVHFHIKGTRDPYALTGFGAGFVKSWQGNVRFLIGAKNPDREFFQILSDEYVLGIPNLKQYIDNAATGLSRDPSEGDDKSTQYSSVTGDLGRHRLGREADFIKVLAKFINGVRWGLGIVLERSCTADCSKAACKGKSVFHRQCRFFDFRPHWEVHTKTADAAVGPTGTIADSFAGFRSDFIHFSISLTSPLTLSLPSGQNLATDSDDSTSSSGTHAGEFEESFEPSKPAKMDRGYNSLHFTPQAATHFFAWWKLFDGSMSLPIRQGKLFPSATPPSKKFGKHCATIKYRFALSPLFVSHSYRQESWGEWANGETTVLGLKGKIGRFNVDLHQREQEETKKKVDSSETTTVMHKAFYQAEIDLDGVDLRVVSAVFSEPEKRLFAPPNLEEEELEGKSPGGNETVDDEDLDWVDLDDFVDAIYTIPDKDPSLKVLPFIVCPRFTFYRHADAGEEHEKEDDEDVIGADRIKTKFGKENSHTCLMGCATDPITVQLEAAQARLEQLKSQRNTDMKVMQLPSSELDLRIRAIERIVARLHLIQDRQTQQWDGSPNLSSYPKESRDSRASEPPQRRKLERKATHSSIDREEDDNDETHLPHINSSLYEEFGEWQNKYMIHNPTIQVSNKTREILLKYYYSSRERKGLVYQLSASAIKFIRDLAKEREQTNRRQWSRRKSTRTGSAPKRPTPSDNANGANRLLDEIASGTGDEKFWASSDSADKTGAGPFAEPLQTDPDSAADNLPDTFDLRSGHLCTFIKPQIALSSDMDDKSTIIITAFRAQLKAYSVIDLRVADDPVNADVMHQTFGAIDGLQVFYPRDQLKAGKDGTFVPLETLVDLRVEPWGFDRLVPRTSASLRYDKFNQLRMSSRKPFQGDDGSGKLQRQLSHFQTGTDRIAVECAKFSVSANPDHFAAIYNVVTDLMLYSDPLQKSRTEKLEKIVFTHDFANLHGVALVVNDLQQRIRSLIELGQQYQIHLDDIDDEGRLDLFSARADAVRLSADLALMVKALAKVQDMNGPSANSNRNAGVQFEARASEIVWHMHDKTDVPFAKFSVNGVEFSWINKQDSSISNRLIIMDLKALNSSPEHVFAEIIAKQENVQEHELSRVNVFAAVLWNCLAPVGGISIVEQFEVHLHPVRLQLEHRVGRRILDYLFVQRRKQNEEIGTIEPSASNRSLRPPSIMSNTSATASRSADSLLLSQKSFTNLRTMNGVDDDRGLPSPRHVSGISSSASSIHSMEHKKLRPVASFEVLSVQGSQEEGLDADEMRSRAALNRTFVLVDISASVLCLTYRSEKEDHSRLFDVYNITYKTPTIQYRNKTWSFLDLLDELKKDIIKSVWSQKAALIGQMLQSAHRRLPLTDARSAATNQVKKSLKNRLNFRSGKTASMEDLRAPSPLRLAITQPASLVRSNMQESPVGDSSDTEPGHDRDYKSDHLATHRGQVINSKEALYEEPDTLTAEPLGQDSKRRSDDDGKRVMLKADTIAVPVVGRQSQLSDEPQLHPKSNSLPQSIDGLSAKLRKHERRDSNLSLPPSPSVEQIDDFKAKLLLGKSFV